MVKPGFYTSNLSITYRVYYISASNNSPHLWFDNVINGHTRWCLLSKIPDEEELSYTTYSETRPSHTPEDMQNYWTPEEDEEEEDE